MLKKKRGNKAFGETHGRAKLTAEDVQDIRRRISAKEKYRDIAKIYGINFTGVYAIKIGRNWKSLSPD